MRSSLVASADAANNLFGKFFNLSFGDLPSEIQRAKAENRAGVLLVFEQEGCSACERLNRTILGDQTVQKYFIDHFLAIRVDIRGDLPMISFDGTETIEKKFSLSQRVRATPTCVFYGIDGKEVTRVIGVPKSVGEFMAIGQNVVSSSASVLSR